MILIYDKINKKVIENMGTNSAFPYGNIPNLPELPEGQEYIRYHDNSKEAKEILEAERIKSLEYEQSPEAIALKEKSQAKSRIQEINTAIPDLLSDMLDFCVSNGFKPKKSHTDLISEYKSLKSKL